MCLCLQAANATAAESPADTDGFLYDRGTGIPTSLFGTYVRKNELLVYGFYEYETNDAEEYHPSELGFAGGNAADQDFLGELETHEFDFFIAYGLTDRIAVELEAQLNTTANFSKAPNDPSAVPARIRESGFGEVESQVRYRMWKETWRRPELFSFIEVAYPLQRDKVLIGVSDWQGELGFGVVKGFPWGTLSGRYSLAYEEGGIQGGEYAIEYLKRLSPRWRAVLAFEGEGEDLSLIAEGQLFFTPRLFLKLNCGFGLTTKVPDFAPEVGLMMSLGPAR